MKRFGISGPTFERLVMRFVRMISDHAYVCLVVKNTEFRSMNQKMEEKMVFKYFPFARFATDVTFQREIRPNGNIQEGKRDLAVKTSFMVTK